MGMLNFHEILSSRKAWGERRGNSNQVEVVVPFDFDNLDNFCPYITTQMELISCICSDLYLFPRRSWKHGFSVGFPMCGTYLIYQNFDRHVIPQDNVLIKNNLENKFPISWCVFLVYRKEGESWACALQIFE